MKHPITSLTFLLALLLPPSARSETVWESYPGFSSPGEGGIVIGDFNGDGKPEAAVTGNAMSTFPVYTYLIGLVGTDTSGRLDVHSITPLPDYVTGPIVLAPREGLADRLAVCSSGENNRILILGGSPLRVLRSIEAPQVIRVHGIADVDGDNQPEIVALATLVPNSGSSTSFPVLLDYETGAIKWAGPDGVDGVGLLPIDGGTGMKLVLTGTPGRVIDGVSKTLEWIYPAGFGKRVMVGKFFASTAETFFATTSYGLTALQVFGSAPFRHQLNIPTIQANAAATVRLATGPDRIAIGSWDTPGLIVYGIDSRQPVLDLNPTEIGIQALGAGDLDGDGRVELIFGTNLARSAPDVLRVVDTVTLTNDLQRHEEVGPLSTVARGDLTGNGGDQVAYLSRYTSASQGGVHLRVLDAQTGQAQRRRDLVFDGYEYQPALVAAQMDSDSQAELVMVASKYSEGIVAVIDGLTLQDQWRKSTDDYTSGAAMLDVNADGILDVITTISSRLSVLDGRNGALLWQSITFFGDGEAWVAAFRAADSAPRTVIARGTGVYVFDPLMNLLVTSASTIAPIDALTQWGDGTDCRLGLLGHDSILSVRRCTNLEQVAQYTMPPGTQFFRPLNAGGDHFVAADNRQLFEVKSNGIVAPLSGDLGTSLGARNFGLVLAQTDAQHFDLAIGSDYMVTRVRVGLDELFDNGFENEQPRRSH